MKPILSTGLILLSVTAIALNAGTPARPVTVLPEPERLLLWSPQEKTVGFRSMQKIAPVHEVKRGAKVFPLPYASSELAVPETTSFLEKNDVAGLIVVRDGVIQLERYALGFDETSVWTSFSVAKSITSTLVGCAVADGRIKSVDDPVTNYLPALRKSAYEGVTVRQVLNMTSGVKWNEDYSDPESDVNRAHRATDKTLGSPLLTYLAKLPHESPPGTKFVYKTAETDLAGEIVMAAVRKPLNQYLSEKIWSPFGMERTAWWMTRDDREYGGCCLNMSLRDYARFGVFFLNGGIVHGRPLLPPDWTKQALTPTAASNGGYGYQWWIDSANPQLYSARGIFGQSIRFDPAERLVIVILSAWPTPLDSARREAENEFQRAVVRALHVR